MVYELGTSNIRRYTIQQHKMCYFNPNIFTEIPEEKSIPTGNKL